MKKFIKPDHRVYVLSLPRCGSSMVTGLISQKGLDVNIKETTEDEETRAKAAKNYKKQFGEYVPNDHFYELTENLFGNWVDIYNTPFSGCKVILPICQRDLRWKAITAAPAKVLMMWREPEEIRQSQEAFYSVPRTPANGEEDPAEMAVAWLRTVLSATDVLLESQRDLSKKDNDVPAFDFRKVRYRDILENPVEKVTKIAEFIGADPKNIQRAVDTIDPEKIRFKLEELDIGI